MRSRFSALRLCYAAGLCRAAPLIIAAPVSAIMIVGALVLVELTAGITEASMTRSPSNKAGLNGRESAMAFPSAVRPALAARTWRGSSVSSFQGSLSGHR
jgi:hypothetical protein